MNIKKQIIIIIILLLLLAVAYFFSDGSNGKIDNTNLIKGNVFNVDVVEAEHNFKSGLHDYTGAIMFPTPCYRMSVDAVVKESFPEDVTIRFTIEEDKTIEICAQVITEKKFRIIFQASEEAKVSVTFNNKPVELKIIEKSKSPAR